MSMLAESTRTSAATPEYTLTEVDCARDSLISERSLTDQETTGDTTEHGPESDGVVETPLDTSESRRDVIDTSKHSKSAGSSVPSSNSHGIHAVTETEFVNFRDSHCYPQESQEDAPLIDLSNGKTCGSSQEGESNSDGEGILGDKGRTGMGRGVPGEEGLNGEYSSFLVDSSVSGEGSSVWSEEGSGGHNEQDSPQYGLLDSEDSDLSSPGGTPVPAAINTGTETAPSLEDNQPHVLNTANTGMQSSSNPENIAVGVTTDRGEENGVVSTEDPTSPLHEHSPMSPLPQSPTHELDTTLTNEDGHTDGRIEEAVIVPCPSNSDTISDAVASVTSSVDVVLVQEEENSGDTGGGEGETRERNEVEEEREEEEAKEDTEQEQRESVQTSKESSACAADTSSPGVGGEEETGEREGEDEGPEEEAGEREGGGEEGEGEGEEGEAGKRKEEGDGEAVEVEVAEGSTNAPPMLLVHTLNTAELESADAASATPPVGSEEQSQLDHSSEQRTRTSALDPDIDNPLMESNFDCSNLDSGVRSRRTPSRDIPVLQPLSPDPDLNEQYEHLRRTLSHSRRRYSTRRRRPPRGVDNERGQRGENEVRGMRDMLHGQDQGRGTVYKCTCTCIHVYPVFFYKRVPSVESRWRACVLEVHFCLIFVVEGANQNS